MTETSAPEIQILKSYKCFGGYVQRVSHNSEIVKTEMKFHIFLPPKASTQPVPVLYWLSGLTCTDENFITKACAQRVASELNIALVCPDTSPRGAAVEGEDESYDFGTGAGFYLNATEPPFSTNYLMYDYITQELRHVVNARFPVLPDRQSIFGHSMGGHGALTIALKNPNIYRSVSAFAPICYPSECPWGIKAFTGYLGPDKQKWKEYDATLLMREAETSLFPEILIDQGGDDEFLVSRQLLPEAFQAACAEKGQQLTLNIREGYDHSYYFISTFIEEHLTFHSKYLNDANPSE